jgi:hypothetical protein
VRARAEPRRDPRAEAANPYPGAPSAPRRASLAVERHVQMEAPPARGLRERREPHGREERTETHGEPGALGEPRRRARIEIEDERSRRRGRVRRGEERVQLDRGRVRGPRERRRAVQDAVSERLPAGAPDLRDAEPLRPARGAVRLVPAGRVHAVRESGERHRPPCEVRENRRRNREVVLGEITLREAPFREEHLVRIREEHRPPLHLERTLRAIATAGHGAPKASGSSGASAESCSRVHERPSRSGRHRTSRAGWRKRWSSSRS